MLACQILEVKNHVKSLKRRRKERNPPTNYMVQVSLLISVQDDKLACAYIQAPSKSPTLHDVIDQKSCSLSVVSAGAASQFLDDRNIISADADRLPLRQSRRIVGGDESLPADDLVYLCCEGFLDIQGFLSGCLHEKQPLLLYKITSFVRSNGEQVMVIRLVSHQHNHDVAVRVLPKLLQPSSHALVCRLARQIVHEQRPHRSPLVIARDGTVP